MINGLGVLGWGVGGIEAEAAMLGQPISMLLPQVVGFRLTGELLRGRDRDRPRAHGHRDAPRARRGRASSSSSSDPGCTRSGSPTGRRSATCRRSSARPARSSRSTARRSATSSSPGRPTELIELVDAYAREQGLFHAEDSEEPTFSETLELDLGDVEPSIAGPKRPQDRIALADAKPAFIESLREFDPEAAEALGNSYDEAVAESFPASDPPGEEHNDERGKPRTATVRGDGGHRGARADPVTVTLEDGTEAELDHGRVVIAAITSCTNTSNPSVMVAAGLLAQKAVERGLERQAVGEDLAGAGLDRRHRLPGAGGAHRVPRQARVQPGRLRLHHLHRQLGPAGRGDLGGGQRQRPGGLRGAVRQPQLRGPDQPGRRNNYLASPPLCVAYALAGRMDVDILNEPLGEGSDGEPVYLRDIWPSSEEIKQTVAERGPLRHVHEELRRRVHGRRALERARDPRGRPLRVAGLHLRPQAALLRGHGPRAAAAASRSRARACSPCSATASPPTTSRRPARSRRTARPAAG